MRTQVTFTGLSQLREALNRIPNELKSEILGPAVAKAAEPIRSRAAALAPRDSGALAESMAIKLLANKRRGTAVAIIGPQTGGYQNGKRMKSAGGTGAVNRPSKYAHLVEEGHIIVPRRAAGSKRSVAAGGHRFVAPRPFLRPAVAAGAGETQTILAEEITNGIEKTRRKLVAQGVHSS